MNVKTFLICMLALFFLGVCRASAVVFSKETFTYAGVYLRQTVYSDGHVQTCKMVLPMP